MTQIAPNPVDIYIGSRCRKIRKMVGYSQKDVAGFFGTTISQIQKYEQGKITLTGSQLYDFATLFNVPADFFYADMPESIARQSPANLRNSLFWGIHTTDENNTHLTNNELDFLTLFRKLATSKEPLLFEILKEMTSTKLYIYEDKKPRPYVY